MGIYQKARCDVCGRDIAQNYWSHHRANGRRCPGAAHPWPLRDTSRDLVCPVCARPIVLNAWDRHLNAEGERCAGADIEPPTERSKRTKQAFTLEEQIRRARSPERKRELRIELLKQKWNAVCGGC